MTAIVLINKNQQTSLRHEKFGKADVKYMVIMVILDIIAPISLMLGLTSTNASTASLLNNFEIVFTALIAMFFFKEVIGRKMWAAIILIISAGGLLAFQDFTGIQISYGSLFVIFASLAWGFENNCTRMLAKGNPLHVVMIKGFGSGLGSLIIAIALGLTSAIWYYVILAMILGFFSYGLSLYFYISAQRHLGAARTSAYYAMAPFVGAIFSFAILGEAITLIFIIAFSIMVIGAYLAIKENNNHLNV